jgi:hypothetical protein
VLGDLKKTLNSLDYTSIYTIVDKELEGDEELKELRKDKKNFFAFRNLQIEKIEALDLHKKTK